LFCRSIRLRQPKVRQSRIGVKLSEKDGILWVIDSKAGHVWMVTPGYTMYQGELSSKMEKRKLYKTKNKRKN
jgi:hypothetical protein